MQPDDSVLYAVIAIAIIVFSCVVHEVSHAWVAYRLGDPTAFLQGRLTLNPIVHIDPIQSILMPALFYITTNGTFIFGGARPVPIDPSRFRRPAEGLALSALAGPVSNFLMAVAAAAVAGILNPRAPAGSINDFLIERVLIPFYLTNVFLGVFNLIPIPPLDGSRVLRFFLHPETRHAYDSFGSVGLVLLIFLMATGILNPVFIPVQVFAGRFFNLLQFQ